MPFSLSRQLMGAGMHFQREIQIQSPPEEVFRLLRDKHTYPLEPDSPVLALVKTTPGPVSVGTRYREVVRMMPWYTEKILSTITRFEPPHYLEEDFNAGVMYGHLAYQIVPQEGGALLVQTEEMHFKGLLRLFEPMLKLMLLPRIETRLQDIKSELESKHTDA
jgi:uncharacterized protein YndB with AHSA1/START domain